MNTDNHSRPEQDAYPETPNRREMLRTWVQFARTHAKFVHRMSHVFSRHALTGPQFDVLATLHRGEGIMQQELAARLLVTKGNVTGVVDRMEALDWIERRPDPEDRRVNRLYLTDAGKEKFRAVIPEHDAVIQGAMADFGAEEIHTLSRLLRKFEDGIQK